MGTRISELPLETIPLDADFVPAVKAGVTSRFTWESIKSFFSYFPKPIAYASGLALGECTISTLVGAQTWTNPGGTWIYIADYYTTATMVFLARYTGVTAANIVGVSGQTAVITLIRIS